MNVRPLNDFVMVERDESEEKSPGGIIIPENAKEPLTRGTVVAVGRGKHMANGTFVETNLKNGERVMFGKYSGQEFKLEGKELLMMREEDIYGVIEEG